MEYVEALAIMMAVGIVVLVTAGNDWSKERKFRGLQERISKEQHVDALRDGDINPLNVTDILVGDIGQLLLLFLLAYRIDHIVSWLLKIQRKQSNV